MRPAPERGSSLTTMGLAVAALAVLFAIGSLIVGATAAVRDDIAYCKFQRALTLSDGVAGVQSLTRLFNPPVLFRYFSSSGARNGMDQATKWETLKDLHGVLEVLTNGKAEKAVMRFNSLRNERLVQLVNSVPPERALGMPVHDLQKAFFEFQGLLKEKRAAEEDIPGTIKANEQRISQIRGWLRDLSEEFAHFLSFPPDLTKDRVEFFQGGVLHDLPKLPQLPDDIPDLVALREALQKAGGEVRLQGARIPERFKEKIESFRASSMLFRSDLESLSRSNSELQEKLKAGKVQALEKSLILRAKIELLLRQAARPEPSRVSARILKVWPQYRECLQNP